MIASRMDIEMNYDALVVMDVFIALVYWFSWRKLVIVLTLFWISYPLDLYVYSHNCCHRWEHYFGEYFLGFMKMETIM